MTRRRHVVARSSMAAVLLLGFAGSAAAVVGPPCALGRVEGNASAEPSLRHCFLLWLAQWSYGAGDYRRAETILTVVTDAARNELGPEHRETLRALQGLAFTRFRLGRYDEAEAILREVIPLAPEARAEDLNTRGAVQGSRLYLSQWLALALVQQQRFDEAESILESIVAEAESLAGGDSLFLLHTLPSLSRVFDGQARYAEALRIDERVLRATGTPYAMQDLAIAYARFGRYEESEPLFRGALKGYSDSKGPDHPLTLHVRDNIASLLASTGRQDEAVAMRRELFAARRRVLGEWHEATLDSQESLAVLLAETGQLPEAMALARDAVAGRRFANGPRDLATGGGLAALGRVLLSAGDRDGAAEQLREALEIYRDVLGGDHPSAARLLATYLAVLGDLTGSLEALRSAAVRGLSDARSLEQDPVLAPLLELPGMQRLLEDLRSRADATRRTLSSELGVR